MYQFAWLCLSFGKQHMYVSQIVLQINKQQNNPRESQSLSCSPSCCVAPHLRPGGSGSAAMNWDFSCCGPREIFHSQAWWHVSIIPALGRPRQENHRVFQASLNVSIYGSSRQSLNISTYGPDDFVSCVSLSRRESSSLTWGKVGNGRGWTGNPGEGGNNAWMPCSEEGDTGHGAPHPSPVFSQPPSSELLSCELLQGEVSLPLQESESSCLAVEPVGGERQS